MNALVSFPFFLSRPILYGIVLLVGSLSLTGCGSDLSTPQETIDSAQEALSERNWDRLYTTTSTRWRERYLSKWRSHLRNLLRRTDAVVNVEASAVDQLSDKQIFRTYLEALARSRRTKQLMNGYANATISIEKRQDDRAVVRASSPLPLPEHRATLKRKNGKWKFERLGKYNGNP